MNGEGEVVDVMKRGPTPRRYADPDAMAELVLGYLKGTDLPAVAIHDVLRRLPRSLRSVERAVRRVEPIKAASRAGTG